MKIELYSHKKRSFIYGWLFLLIFIVASIDQCTKYYIVYVLKLKEHLYQSIEIFSFLSFTYVENRGVTFGLFTGGDVSRIVLSLLTFFVIIFLVNWLFRIKSSLTKVGLAFVIGGAIGNLIDRVILGYVVDFFDVSKLYFPWVFNTADIFINIGIIFLLFDHLFCQKKSDDQINI